MRDDAQFQLYIHTDNDAFHPEPGPEIARILHLVARRVEDGADLRHFQTLRDVNGNDVGRVRLLPNNGE